MPGIASYNAKRDFRATPEPRGRIAPRASVGGLRYVIQKHDASHLHYDFRLEIGGVLVSWAIPKGPSLDPAVKRLAVRTEDHPTEYGSFEGKIPEGQYGGGTVMLWDRGSWEPLGSASAGLKKGTLKFILHGERLQGQFVLTRLKPRNGEKRENWLLIKHGDEAALPGSGEAVVRAHTDSVATHRDLARIAAGKKIWNSKPAAPAAAAPTPAKRVSPAKLDPAKIEGARQAPLARKMAPQLATLVEQAPEQGEWLSEIKFDGYRMLARIDNGEVKLISRNGLAWSHRVPSIVKALEKLPLKQAWLDGELVAVDGEGHSDFCKLQDALSHKPATGLTFYLFDLLHLNGLDLGACRQDRRKALLAALLGDAPPPLKYSDHFEGVPERVREHACAMGLEGIICKRADAPYRQARSRNWLKLKCIAREEFVVIGYTEPRGSRNGFGALHVGYYDEGGALHYAGGVGTGFNQATLKSLRTKLAALERRIGPSIVVHGEGPPKGLHWVAPKLVIETQYLEMTADSILRHAVFMGLRQDKAAEDVIRAAPADPAARKLAANAVISNAPSPPRPKPRKAPLSAPSMPAIIDNRKRAGAIVLTHPDKLLWPDDKLTKADLAAYWAALAPLALPHIAGRALALVRCPEGIAGQHFFQKKASPGFPRAIADLKLGKDRVVAIADAEGLQALAQISAIELHPWGSRLDKAEKPDRLIFDLDPDERLAFKEVVAAAHIVRQALDDAGLVSFCKTTGGKGLHVVAPIRAEAEWPAVKDFCAGVARTLAAAEPKRFIATAAKKARGGKIFIDYLRNARGATAVAPFSPRARAGATIAMPLEWREVTAKLDPRRFTIADPPAIAKMAAGRWREFFDTDQELTAAARKKFTIS